MKRLLAAIHSPRPRPYWHVDAKWLCAILLAFVLAATLPVVAAYRLTAKEPATKLIAYTLAGLTSPQGIDSDEGLAEARARVQEKGSETITFAGIPVTFTAENVATLSPRELRLKVFDAFAERLYDKGVTGLAKEQGLDQAASDQFTNDASLLSVFTADTHQRIGTIMWWMVLACALLLAGLILFSHRFGRLVSPGVVLALVGLPGIVLAAIANQNPEVTGAARSDSPGEGLAMIGLFAAYVGPLVVPTFASTYLFVLITGAVLLVLAGLGKITFWTIRRAKTTKEEPTAHGPARA